MSLKSLALAVPFALTIGCAADATDEEPAPKEPAPEVKPEPAPAPAQATEELHVQGLASIPVGTAGKHH